MTDPDPGAPGHDRYLATTRFGSLDGLRFVCIAAVLWHHAPVWHGPAGASVLATRGFLGVDFFFVISGFLITTLLVRERPRGGRFSLRGFYWRRALRILPVYVLVVTAIAAYYVVVRGETRYLELLPFYYLFLSNFLVEHVPMLAPTWSLSVEEQFYLLWPLALGALPPRALLWVLPALVALNVVAVTGALRPLGVAPVEAGPLRFALFNATYAPILMGAWLALALDGARGHALLAPLLGRRWSPAAAFAALGALLVVLPRDLVGLPNLLVHASMTLALATVVLREDHVLRPVLAWRPIARVGEVSYGIYLYHLIALFAATRAMEAVGLGAAGDGGAWGWALLAAYSALSVAIAEASFRLYESPFLALRHRPWRRAPDAAETRLEVRS